MWDLSSTTVLFESKIVSWYRKIKTYYNLNSEIKKYHESFDKPKKPEIREVGKFGDKDWSISIGDVDE